MYELIVSEKDNTARRIAQILSEDKLKTEKVQKVPAYFFSRGGKDFSCIGLKGHILKVDFPLEYQDWQKVDPKSLIDAPIIKIPSQKAIIKALQSLAKGAERVIIACDFDREGELIGVDALNKIREINSSLEAKRARFSALTDIEIKRAFDNLDDVYVNLARAGETRQDIDLIWGATLTRFLSLASRRLWKQFLSVGRVQSPTLSFIVQREKERKAFIPKSYWQLKGLFGSREGEFVALHKQGRFWDKEELEKILAKLNLSPTCRGVTRGKVVSVQEKERNLTPPAPFNTTAFLIQAAIIGVPPSMAMRIAESLYIRGFISYPRVDNTVYPSSLNLRDILNAIKESPDLGGLVKEVLTQEKIIPTKGKKFSTDHPPIHPTGVALKEK
ncbi:MAG: DNA topoisomerase, partial [Candidatus Subteraquimicrobiales bacterium]|nr:DNA topoisomerase [Candidatus Subteraquimicrobiales bacterium]